MRFEGFSRERSVLYRLNLIIGLLVLQIILSFVVLFYRPSSSSPPPQLDSSQSMAHTPSGPGEKSAELTFPNNEEQENFPLVEKKVDMAELTNPPPVSVIRVQVLNGCGVPGIAKRARDWLVRRNYEVRDMGNADRMDYRQTLLIDRKGDRVAAMKLAEHLNLPHSRISTRLIPSGLDFEVTLVIGKDYRQLPFAR